MYLQSEPAPRERRRHPRAATHRSAVFSSAQQGGILRKGEASDISLTGLQVRTRRPEPPGTAVSVELHPKFGKEVDRLIIVRGRVVYARCVTGRDYAMGIRLEAPMRNHAPAIRDADTAQSVLESIRGHFRQVPPDAPSPLAVIEALRHSPLETAGPSSHRSRIRQVMGWAAAVLLMLAALWCFWPVTPQQVILTQGNTGTPLYLRTPPAEEPESDLPWTSGYERGIGELPIPQQDEGDLLLARLRAYVDRGDVFLAENGSDGFAAATPYYYDEPADELLRQMDAARILAAMDRTEEAAVLLSAALETAPALPAPWQSVADDLRAVISAHDSNALRGICFQDGIEVAARSVHAASIEDPLPSLYVSKQEHVLTVYRGGLPVMRFPVGLGKAGSTPDGAFYIVNRIANPDWYDRGRVVKHGDPENPLGGQWMGLGRAGTATSYGIHPTKELDSIGRDRSRGCIRMRPCDARILFSLCEIGTPVTVGP